MSRVEEMIIYGVCMEIQQDLIDEYCFNPDEVSKRTGKVLASAIKSSQQWLLDNFTGHYRIIWKLEQILKELGIK